MNKRLISVVLSICMLVCLVPVVQVSAAECFLDKEMFNSSHLSICKKIKMLPEVPSKIKSELFNLNESGSSELSILNKFGSYDELFNLNKSGSVVGYIKLEEDLSFSGWVAPRNPGDTVCLPENSKGFFERCSSAIEIDLRGLDTSHVTNMSRMFNECRYLQSLDLRSFNTANVTDMSGMFSECVGLQSLDLRSFNTANVTNMHSMFEHCGLKSLDLSGFNTANVTDMSGMFCKCGRLQSLDLRSFNTCKVEKIYEMFEHCQSLESLDLSSFSTSRVSDMSNMFLNCENLKRLDISRFNMDNVYNIEDMLNFGSSTAATVIYCSDKIWKRISSKESGLPSTAKHAAYIDERMLCDALRLKISDDGVTKIAVANRVPFGTDGVMPLNKEGSYLCYVEKRVFYIAPNRRVALTSIPPVGLPLFCDSMLRGFKELTEIDLSGIDRY